MRNRLLAVMTRHIARGPRGIKSEGWNVDGEDLDHQLTMETGQEKRFENVVLRGDYHDVLTAVEKYVVAAREAYRVLDKIMEGLHQSRTQKYVVACTASPSPRFVCSYCGCGGNATTRRWRSS